MSGGGTDLEKDLGLIPEGRPIGDDLGPGPLVRLIGEVRTLPRARLDENLEPVPDEPVNDIWDKGDAPLPVSGLSRDRQVHWLRPPSPGVRPTIRVDDL